MIAAIGNDGWQPVVWGLGETVSAALDDAERWYPREQRHELDDLHYVPVPDELAQRILAGEVACETLGIKVRLAKDGTTIRDAWVL